MRYMMTRESLTLAIEEEDAIREGRPGVEVLRLRLTSWHCSDVALNDWQWP